MADERLVSEIGRLKIELAIARSTIRNLVAVNNDLLDEKERLLGELHPRHAQQLPQQPWWKRICRRA